MSCGSLSQRWEPDMTWWLCVWVMLFPYSGSMRCMLSGGVEVWAGLKRVWVREKNYLKTPPERHSSINEKLLSLFGYIISLVSQLSNNISGRHRPTCYSIYLLTDKSRSHQDIRSFYWPVWLLISTLMWTTRSAVRWLAASIDTESVKHILKLDRDI